MTDWAEIAGRIAAATGCRFTARDRREVRGGCINRAVHLCDGQRSYFVKLNRRDAVAMFEAESEGLTAIRASNSVRAPAPVCHGVAADEAYLVLEFVHFGGAGPDSERRLGAQLAAMHQSTAEAFGWRRDNTIGSTLQVNQWESNWCDFLAKHRLGFQLALAERNNPSRRLQDTGLRLSEKVRVLLEGHRPMPSLLHGDLWSGNAAYDRSGSPVIFDPAVYYGDREADLAMTELFGGFGPDFYAAYNAAAPVASGYPVRRDLYNLYHVLNHLNLFGGGYERQAQHLMERLLAEVG